MASYNQESFGHISYITDEYK